MKKNKLFYQSYDAFFLHKDYAGEVDFVLDQAKKYGINKPKKILEIGAGTGNHTVFLSQKASIVAIDTDEEMLAVAENKFTKNTPTVRLIHSTVENLKENNFDIALALFNVVNYIEGFEKLVSFMKGTSDRLKTSGIFIFDSWNGIAAIKDPPRTKTTYTENEIGKIQLTVTPTTDFIKQNTLLTYNIEVRSGKKLKKHSFSFVQTLWTPMEIRTALKIAGLRVIKMFPLLQPEKTLTEQDWKMMFICKKDPR